MRILVLEDNPYRIRRFQQSLIGHITDFVDNASDAINLLKNNVYDLIFLDHDLGGMSYVDSTEYNTGYTVAKFISRQKDNSAKIIIHSSNYSAAERMKSLLPKARHLSFIFLNLDIKGILNE